MEDKETGELEDEDVTTESDDEDGEDEETDDDRTDKYKVNIVNLSPSPLMKMKLTSQGHVLDALIDTGASCDIIKKSVVEKLGLCLRKEGAIRIAGLGIQTINTVGKVYMGFSFGTVNVKRAAFTE